jgi:dTMP kinase
MVSEQPIRRGRFITLEGPEGSGKSTQAARLKARLEAAGLHVVLTREPGGTALGQQLRAVLFDPKGPPLAPMTEAMILSADRAQHVAEVIAPALTAGVTVISDRYFDSMLAYQGFGRSMDLVMLETLISLATGGIRPDLTLLFDLDIPASLARRRKGAAAGEGELNRFDQRAVQFHERVREGFIALAEREPERFVRLDAALTPDELELAVWERVGTLVTAGGARRQRKPRGASQLPLGV